MNKKELIKYFKKAEKIIVQRTEEGYFIADDYIMFSLSEIPQEFALVPIEVGDIRSRYEKVGWFVGGPDLQAYWTRTWEGGKEKDTVEPTQELYEPLKGLLVRYFTGGVNVDKRHTDILGGYWNELKDTYFFITEGEKHPLCVITKRGEKVAILMPRQDGNR